MQIWNRLWKNWAKPPSSKNVESVRDPYLAPGHVDSAFGVDAKAIDLMIKVCGGGNPPHPVRNQRSVAVDELKKEGAQGANALAALIRELLQCRCPEIRSALLAASELTPTDDLIAAVKEVCNAPDSCPGIATGRFTPGVSGAGTIALHDRQIPALAAKTLRTWGALDGASDKPAGEAPASPQAPNKPEPVAADKVQTDSDLRQMIVDFGSNPGTKYNDFDFSKAISRIGHPAFLVINNLLHEHLNDEIGRAAVIALNRTPEDCHQEALAIVRLALQSTYDATRTYASGYLCRYRARSGSRELAEEFVWEETHPSAQKNLELAAGIR